MTTLQKYQNGNCFVEIFDDGTKVRSCEGDPNPEFPESIDVKCTDYCEGAGCRFCHENSTVNGIHSDYSVAQKVFSGLAAGTELAIGGGNPLDWPYLSQSLEFLNNIGVISNITVNSLHIKDNKDRIRDFAQRKLVHGVGISYFSNKLNECAELANENGNIIFHLIMGVHSVKDLQDIVDKVNKPKVLLLGYKQFGRGINFHSQKIDNTIYEWYTNIHKFFGKDIILSFDNLGIKQMNLRRFFVKDDWSKFYMGDDGKFTMYIDLTKRQYAVSSTSKERFSIGDKSVRDMFSHIKSLCTS